MWSVFALFVGGMTVALVLVHGAVYATIAHWLQFKSLWLQLVFLAAPLGFIITSIIGNRVDNWLIRLSYYLSSAWLGLFNFLLIASALMWLIWLAGKVFDWTLPGAAIMIVLIGAAVAVFVYGLINAQYPRIKTYTISSPNLPPAWPGRQAVWVSDLHLGHIRGEAFARQVVDDIKALKPDIVFVGGDLFDGSAGDLVQLAAPFGELAPPLGTYFITGNHEEFNDPERYLTVVKNLGLKVLTNESVEIDGLILVGVDWRDGSQPDRFKKAVSLIGANLRTTKNQDRFVVAFDKITDKNQFSILLNHYPGNLELANEAGINLQLSGHSHRGQIWPYNYVTNWVYHGYDYGLKKYKDLTVITSAGAGTWGPPLRAGADPDILLIKFSQ